MTNEVKMGMNRTGVQMSPIDVKQMTEFADSVLPLDTKDSIAQVRHMAMAEVTDGVGSVPVPGTVRGVVAKGVETLKGRRPEVLIDKLGERLAFERTGTRLYEAMLIKCVEGNGHGASELVPRLSAIRDQEAQHFALLTKALQEMGADPTAQTPCADVAAVMSMGLLQVVNDPRTTVAQCLNALLVAELADNASWELLIELAREDKQDELVARFEQAAQHEAEHLVAIKDMLEQALRREASLV